jgi:hypothetical protein
MKQLVVSHALNDVSSDPFFENDEESFMAAKQLASGLGKDAALLNSTPELRPAPPRGPKPYADVPLPPPERPLVWKTKLVGTAVN